MGKIMMELLVVMMTVFLLQRSDAATYTVGDSSGWSTPSNGDSTYTAWASQHQFVTGDILVFNFNTGLHTVATVNNKNDYDSCNTANANVQTNGPVSVTLSSTGVNYFFCTVHCSLGQKLTVNVGSNNNNRPSPPGTSPAPGSNSPSPPPPPPPSTAASAKLFSGLIILPILLAVL